MKPWLWLPPKLSHDLSPYFFKILGALGHPKHLNWKSKSWRHLSFSNPLGISGGVDKNADCIEGWWTLGPGFLEVGTITPRPQKGHTGKVIARDLETLSLWNKMGFPSKGARYAAKNFKKVTDHHFTPLFINIGKNKSTPNTQAHHDYMECIDKLIPYADAFVINISSPNTEGLRELIKPNNLKDFIEPLVEYNLKASKRVKKDITCPLILKLSPDIEDELLHSTLETTLKLNIDGWVLTNTTTKRDLAPFYPKDGGVSGRPLTNRSKEVLKSAIEFLGHKKNDRLLISSGGILTPDEVFERLDLGADLAQVYSALVFSGPSFFKEVADKAALL